MEKIKFTIAVATYNSSLVIEELLNSIFHQTYSNYEVVIVDGLSTDNTLEIAKKWLRSSDKIISEKDSGVYDAMNKALDLATGDFLIFMGSDDHFMSNRVLAEVADAINKAGGNLDTVYYGGCYMDAYHTVSNKVWTKWSWVRGTICHQGIFYPKEVYKKYKYNLLYKINADYAYNINLWNKVNFQHIDVVVSFFNDGGLSGSNRYDMPFRKDFPFMLRNQCGYFPYAYKQIRLFLGRVFKGRP